MMIAQMRMTERHLELALEYLNTLRVLSEKSSSEMDKNIYTGAWRMLDFCIGNEFYVGVNPDTGENEYGFCG